MAMKYIKPETKTYKVELQQMMAGSPELGGNYNGGTPEARGFGFFEEEEISEE